MVYYIISDVIDLPANGSGSIVLKPDVDVTIHKIAVTSTGRVEINAIELIGVRTILKGKLEAASLKEQGNIKILEEAMAWGKGTELSFSLLDVSGAANRVYITAYCTG